MNRDATLEEIFNPNSNLFNLTTDGIKHFTNLKEFWTKTRSINELMTALSNFIKSYNRQKFRNYL